MLCWWDGGGWEGGKRIAPTVPVTWSGCQHKGVLGCRLYKAQAVRGRGSCCKGTSLDKQDVLFGVREGRRDQPQPQMLLFALITFSALHPLDHSLTHSLNHPTTHSPTHLCCSSWSSTPRKRSCGVTATWCGIRLSGAWVGGRCAHTSTTPHQTSRPLLSRNQKESQPR